MHTLIETSARSWVGVPFLHQGRSKHYGCDCLGMILGIAEELAINSRQGRPLKDYDVMDYSLFLQGNALLQAMDTHFTQVNELATGNIILMRIGDSLVPRHLGILGTYNGEELSLIHTHMQVGRVVEHRLDQKWAARIIGTYSFLNY